MGMGFLKMEDCLNMWKGAKAFRGARKKTCSAVLWGSAVDIHNF
jgi:hypothetical protein